MNLSPKRKELLDWFRRKAEPLAEAYEAAIRLLNDKHFPCRVHLIAHAVRDIADRLVFVLDPQLKGRRVQYENAMDKIEKRWPTIEKITETKAKSNEANSVAIDYELASIIDSLVTEHRKRRQGPSNFTLLFRYLMRNEPYQIEVNQRLVRDFAKVRRWFMDLTHLRNTKAPEVDEDKLQSQFSKFESMLHSFVGDFFTGKAELDEILRKANK